MAKKRKPDSAYWKKRFSDLEASQHAYAQKTTADIVPGLEKAQMQVQAKIESWVARFAANNEISMTEARKQLTAAELKEFKWNVQDYIKYGRENAIDGRWMKELENASARYHVSRLQAFQIDIQQAIEVAFGNEVDEVEKMMKHLYTEGYYHTIFEVQKGFNLGFAIDGLNQDKLQRILSNPWAADGRTFSNRIWTTKSQMLTELQQQLVRQCAMGKAPDEAIKAMSKFVDKKFKNAKSQAGRLVMTEEAFISSAAQKDAFKELDVEEFEVVATLDSHTSEICQDMDGKHFPMSQYEIGSTAPPFHVYCRSTTAPYFNDEWSGGERAAKNEDGDKTYYVPSDMTYPEWKKSFVDGKMNNGVKIKSIDECNTVEDVENLFKSHDDWYYVLERDGKEYKSIDGLSLQGLDLDTAKSVYKEQEMLFDKFPMLKGKLNCMKSEKLSYELYADCSIGIGHGGVRLNTQHFKSLDGLNKSYASDVAHGFHPIGTDGIAIVTHEFGHAIDDYLSYTLNLAGFNGLRPKEVSAMLRPKVMKACGFKVSDTYTQVSGYATKNAEEWFAECFAEYMHSKEPRAVATEFGKQLEELMKGCGLL